MRTASVNRNTKETEIAVEVNLDGTGHYDISTGIGFLDHMIEQFSRHGVADQLGDPAVHHGDHRQDGRRQGVTDYPSELVA